MPFVRSGRNTSYGNCDNFQRLTDIIALKIHDYGLMNMSDVDSKKYEHLLDGWVITISDAIFRFFSKCQLRIRNKKIFYQYVRFLSTVRQFFFQHLINIEPSAWIIKNRPVSFRCSYQYFAFSAANMKIQPIVLVNHLVNNHWHSARFLYFRFSQCDCCGGPCYGPGIRIIRPCTLIFGVRNLPFLFHSCGPDCATTFMKSAEGISDIIYGSAWLVVRSRLDDSDWLFVSL